MELGSRGGRTSGFWLGADVYQQVAGPFAFLQKIPWRRKGVVVEGCFNLKDFDARVSNQPPLPPILCVKFAVLLVHERLRTAHGVDVVVMSQCGVTR